MENDVSLQRSRSIGRLPVKKESPKVLRAQRAEKAESGWTRYKARARDLTGYWASEMKHNFGKPQLASDLSAGLTVAAVAIPLNLALAIAAGLPPIVGIISGAIGGILAGILGGSRWQVTGPAAALNVMVASMVAEYGPVAAAGAAMISGILQIILCLCFAGRVIRFVPEAVLAGFTTGVGLKLLDGQLPLLLDIEQDVSQIIQNLHAPTWLHDVSWFSVLCGLFVAISMLALKQYPRLPAALFGLIVVTAVSSYLEWDLHRVGAIPSLIPDAMFPKLEGDVWVKLMATAVPLGLLAAAESLLSARALDRLTKDEKPHHSDLELMGQGVANVGVSLFGGMPVTGVIVRGTANVQSGGRTRLASVFHGVVLICAVLFAGNILGMVPIAALAGLLCVVGMRLIEIHTLVELLRTHRVHAVAFLIAAIGTVTDHLVIGLTGALLLCCLEFVFANRLRKKSVATDAQRAAGIRAIVEASTETSMERQAPHEVQARGSQWIRHVGEQPEIASTAFVHPNASVIGRVVLDHRVHVASEAALRADEGTPFFIGADTNIQDGVVLHALKEKWVTVGEDQWAIYIGRQVSMAHQCLIHGPCYIGDRTFIGFKAIVHDSVVGSGCYIGLGAIVVGVEIPDSRFVPHGMIVDSPEKVSMLPVVNAAQTHFNDDVVEVNQGLVEAYRYQELEDSGSGDRRNKGERESSSARRREFIF